MTDPSQSRTPSEPSTTRSLVDHPSLPSGADPSSSAGLSQEGDDSGSALSEGSTAGPDALSDDPASFEGECLDRIARRLLDLPDAEAWIASRESLPHDSFARSLLDCGRALLVVDPVRARHAAHLAEIVLDADPGPADTELRLVAALDRANAARIAGDLETAADLLNRHHHLIPRCAPGRLRGDLHLVAASILSDEERLPAACEHLIDAIEHYSEARDPVRAAHGLVHGAALVRKLGDIEGAVLLAQCAADIVSPSDHPEIYLSAAHNLAVYLLDAGRSSDARRVLIKILPLYPRGDHPYVVQYRWLCARLAAAADDPRGTAGILEDFRDALCAGRQQLRAAFAVIDLASLHLDDGEVGRAREVLEELVRILPSSSPQSLIAVLEETLARFQRLERPEPALLVPLVAALRAREPTPEALGRGAPG